MIDKDAPMGRGATRSADRFFSSIGLGIGAVTRFERCESVRIAGVLFGLPGLLANGLLKGVESGCFGLPPGYYRPDQIMAVLGLMLLARVENVDGLQYEKPGEWGRVLGLDRIPDKSVMRSKVKIMTSDGEKVSGWCRELAGQWMESDPSLAGTLYVDGHPRVYHGSATALPKRYVSRQKLCLRGMTDYWVNDRTGQPFFVIDTPLTDGLLAMLRTDIVPRLLADVPGQPTQERLDADPRLHRLKIIFDREGYSPAFFLEMWEKRRIACQTYNKYPGKDWTKEEFGEVMVAGRGGERTPMLIAERGVRHEGTGFWMREIRKLSEGGHQTSVVATDYKSDASVMAYDMFSRWCQENYFKYAIENFGIDRLVSRDLEDISDTAEVVNPAWRRLDAGIRSLTAKIKRKTLELLGVKIDKGLDQKKIAKAEKRAGEILLHLENMEKDRTSLKEKAKGVARRIPFSQLPEDEKFKQFCRPVQQFMNALRMIAYRAETALANILNEEWKYPDQSRSLLKEIFKAEADLIPDEAAKTLTVRLRPLSNQRQDEAAKILARHLNDTETVFPGTEMVMRFEMVSG
jgi:hypothetical protein